MYRGMIAAVLLAGHHLRVQRAETAWVPLGFLGLASLTLDLVGETSLGHEAYKVFMVLLPLLVGVSAAWTWLGDPARELVMVSPFPASRLVAHRLGLHVAVWALASAILWRCSLLFGVELAAMSPPARFWLPSLTLASVALAAALLARDAVAGGAAAAGLWFAQVLFRPYLLSLPAAWVLDLFLGLHRPSAAKLAWNQVAMAVVGVGLSLVSARLLSQEERYLG